LKKQYIYKKRVILSTQGQSNIDYTKYLKKKVILGTKYLYTE